MTALNSDEVRALMAEIRASDNGVSRSKRGVLPVDFTNYDRIICGQMRALDAINAQIASSLEAEFSRRTRLNLLVTSTPATSMKGVDVNPLVNPLSIVGVIALGFDFKLALVLFEAGFGDGLLAATLADRQERLDGASHDFTGVERLELKGFLSLLTDSMRRSWAPVLSIQPALLSLESASRFAVICPANGEAILTTFEVSGAIAGRIRLILPEAMKKSLGHPPRIFKGSGACFSTQLSHELAERHVEIAAIRGRSTMSVRQILEVQVGDLVPLDGDEASPVQVLLAGRLKLKGQPRIVAGNHAIVLEGGLQANNAMKHGAGNGAEG